MNQKLIRSAAAVALTAALSTALPAAAAGHDAPGKAAFGPFEQAWRWIAARWLAPDADEAPAGPWTSAFQRDGVHIDPNGKTGTTVCPDTGCVDPQP
jgi:hypothetical protein